MSAAVIVPLSVIGGYAVVSIFLLRFPNLIHQKKQLKINAKLIAHRGGAGEHLENTITAYKHAMASGMDMIELDCQITKDKRVVVAHDDHLQRVTGVDAHISDLNFKDLPLLSRTLAVHFCKGKTVCGSADDRKIPLLREVFETFPDVPINLDIKRDEDDLINKVLDLICEFKREEITVVGNFSESIVKKCHQRAPQVPLIMSMQTAFRVLIAFYAGILPFLRFKEDFFEIPMGRELIKNFGIEKRWMKAIIWIVDFLLINRVMFRHLQRRGIRIYVWVLNSDEQFERALHMGVDGIMTDYPVKLSEYMHKNGHLADRIHENNDNYQTFADEVEQ